jgi:predicted O-methyltransferase YrrM
MRNSATRTKKPDARATRSGRLAHVTNADTIAWYAGKNFAHDWTTWHFPTWFKLLRNYRWRRTDVLEIGSWEGRSAIFFLNYLPRCRLVCVDTFEGGKEHRADADLHLFLKQVENRFDANVREFRPRVEKIRARSADGLTALGLRQRRFDIAYIDGSHLAADVYMDATLTWPLMVRGGLVIFDDYLWDNQEGPSEIPRPGIDAFLATIEGQYRMVWNGYQIAIVKR